MQKMVINKACMSELNSQSFGLLGGWVEAEFIGFSDKHTFILALMFYIGKVVYGGIYGKDLFTFSSPQQAAGYSKRGLIIKLTKCGFIGGKYRILLIKVQFHATIIFLTSIKLVLITTMILNFQWFIS